MIASENLQDQSYTLLSNSKFNINVTTSYAGQRNSFAG